MKGRSEFARSGREEQRHDLDLFLDDNWRMRKNRCRSTCKVIGEQTGSAIMSDAFTPCKATILPGARSVPTLLPTQRLAQPGGSGLEKEGRWFRLEALNMSDLILSRRTLPPSLPPSRALLCNTYKHFEPSCATGFRS